MSITGILLLGGFVVAASLMVARILPALLAAYGGVDCLVCRSAFFDLGQ